ncbi:MAG: hypothetical protein MUF81_05620, partial [Verrucomicrobia bacterium]|nr:hypothetical protein [Verrucomicrobiota bacterium]
MLTRKFSASTVSLLIEMAAFNNPETVEAALKGAVDGKESRYQEPGTKKFLGFYPATGAIIYQDTSAIPEPNQPVENVPNDAQALDLALKILPRLDIACEQLATKPGSAELEIRRGVREMTKTDKATGEKRKTVLARDVIFARRLNGINFAGVGLGGGIEIRFGNKGRVGSLRLVWRELEAFKEVRMASAEQIVQSLKSGRGFVEA